jgi:magnesium-transporting ATPase (P-type)
MKGKDGNVIVLNQDCSDSEASQKNKGLKAKLHDTADDQVNNSVQKSKSQKLEIKKSKFEENDSPDKNKTFSVEESVDCLESEINRSIEMSSVQKEDPVPQQVKSKQVSKPKQPKAKKAPKKIAFDIQGTHEITKIELLSKSLIFQVIYWLLSVATLGLIPLINKWSNNKFYSGFCFRKVSSLQDANYVALSDIFGFFIVSKLAFKSVFISKELECETYVFEHNYRTFYFDEMKQQFMNLADVAEKEIYDNFSKAYKSARLEDEVVSLTETFGVNKLQPNLKSFRSLVIDSILTPLVFFEGLSLALIYMNDEIVYFCLLLAFFSVVLVANTYEKYRAETKLLESINFAEKIMVVRKTQDGIFKKKIIDSAELVIGDLVEITNNLRVPADMILIHGACIIKEDFNKDTTRSSTRIAIDSMGIDEPRNSKCSLLAGNQVLYTLNQINEGCFAIILRTGFNCKRAEKLKLIINNQIKLKQNTWEVFLLISFIAMSCLLPIGSILMNKIFHIGGRMSTHNMIAHLADFVVIFLKPIIPLLILIVVKLSTRRLNQQGITINDKDNLQNAGRLRQIIFENKLLLGEEKITAGFVLNNIAEIGKPVFEKIVTSTKKLLKSAEVNDNTRKFCEVAGLCNLVFKVGNEFFGSETEKEMLGQSAFNLSNLSAKEKFSFQEVNSQSCLQRNTKSNDS